MSSPGFFDWFGVVGQWVGALGSASAAGIAVWMGSTANKRADAAQQEARVSRAALVTARIGWSDPYSDLHMHNIRSDNVIIENHGDSPIFVPRIEAISDSSASYSFKRTNGEVNELLDGMFDPPEAVRGGDSTPLPFELIGNSDAQINADEAKVTISFRDMLGTKWERVGMDSPRPVGEQPGRYPTKGNS